MAAGTKPRPRRRPDTRIGRKHLKSPVTVAAPTFAVAAATERAWPRGCRPQLLCLLRIQGKKLLEMDSNAVENRIRPLALTRKNALFVGHDEGATAWARIASLTETAKLNHVEPYAYLKATLEAIASGHPSSRIDELLPWAFTPASR